MPKGDDDLPSPFANLPGKQADPKEKFARSMERLNIHPILIFGIADAGKSILLASLFDFWRGPDGAGGHLLGDNIEESPFYGVLAESEIRAREGLAKDLYNKGVIDFLRGNSFPSTNTEAPFFVQLQTNFGYSDQIMQKVAFMEGAGEWYELKGNDFAKMKWEIDAILDFFTNPISVVFVAPKALRDEGKSEISDVSLENCIKAYQKSKREKSKDNVMFVISKWDADCTLADFENRDGEFINPTFDQCFKQLKRSKYAWGSFKNLNFREDSKVLTPHSAAIFDSVTYQIKESETAKHKPSLDNFDRIFWDWLGENVFEQHNRKRVEYYPKLGDSQKFKIIGYDKFLWTYVLNLEKPKSVQRRSG